MKQIKEIRKFKEKMKRKPTFSENQFLQYLDKENFKFQMILGFYIIDIVLPERLLAIEIDGKDHEQKIKYDKLRNDFIKKCGLEVLHIKNEECKNKEIIQKIYQFKKQSDYLKKFKSALGKANAFRGLIIKRQYNEL